MASPYDLIAISTVQSWLGQSGDAAVVGQLVTQVSRAILSLLGRPILLPNLYRETANGDGRRSLILRNWPVSSVASLLIDGQAIPASPALSLGQSTQAGYVLEPGDPAPPGRPQALLLRDAWFRRGVQNVVTTYTAGYQVSGETATVPTSLPTLSAQAPYGAWASDCGVAYANGVALTAVASAPGAGQYCVSAGLYSFSPADAGAAVALTYGYVPSDIAEAALEWICDRYAYKGHIGQKSKSLGGQETVSYDLSAVPPFVAAILQPYRRIALPC